MRERLFALLLSVIATLLLLLAGCNTSSPVGQTPAPVSNESGGAPTVPASNESGGASVASATSETEAETEVLSVTMMLTEIPQQPVLLDAPVLQYIRDNFNIDIQLQPVPQSDFLANKVPTVFATNDLPDILVNIPINTISQYAAEGMMVNLSDYEELMPNYTGLIYADDRALETKKFLIDGSLYGFRKLEYDRIALMPASCIRMDLLEEQGIPVPTSFDEMYDAMLKIKATHPDVSFFSSRNGTNYMLGQMAYAFGTGGFPTFSTERGMYFEPDYDKYVYGPTDERFEQLVAFMAKAWADGLVDPDYAINDRNTLWEKITSGKVAYFCDNNSFVARAFNPAFTEAGTNWRMDILPPLANPITTTRAFRYERDWNEHTVISSQCPEIERIIALFDWMYSEEGIMVTNFGIEGETYTVDQATGNPLIVDSILQQASEATDKFAAIQGIIGVGAWSWTPYIDERTQLQIDSGDYIRMAQEVVTPYTDNGTITYLPNWPAFTAEEMEEIVELESALTNVFNQEIDSFIMNNKDMSEWSAVVETLKAAGSAQLEEIFNAAYARLL